MKLIVLLSAVLLAACQSSHEAPVADVLSGESLARQLAIAKRINADLNQIEAIAILSIGHTLESANIANIGFIGRYPILAEASVDNREEIDLLAISLTEGIRNAPAIYMLCFTPRHAIRYTLNGRTTEFLICFECFKVQIIENGESTEFKVTRVPETIWDRVFAKYNLPKAP